MGEWQPINSAPKEVEVHLLLDCGREALGEYWNAPPVEIDPEQECQGWAICLMGAGELDLGLMAEPGNPTHWKPLTGPLAAPITEDDIPR